MKPRLAIAVENPPSGTAAACALAASWHRRGFRGAIEVTLFARHRALQRATAKRLQRQRTRSITFPATPKSFQRFSGVVQGSAALQPVIGSRFARACCAAQPGRRGGPCVWPLAFVRPRAANSSVPSFAAASSSSMKPSTAVGLSSSPHRLASDTRPWSNLALQPTVNGLPPLGLHFMVAQIRQPVACG